MLTTLLLTDAVEKGGPGSGPTASSSKAAHKATIRAQRKPSKENHLAAAKAHEEASAANRKAGNEFTASIHDSAASQHRGAAAVL
jgi:hypothetical protein